MIEKTLHTIRHHLTIVRTVATKRVIKAFAEKYNLVYFGSVNQHADDHQLVRGVTLSSAHKDRHYCVGVISGYDVLLVQRTDTLIFPHQKTKHYTWLILQFDLHMVDSNSSRHVLLSSQQHTEVFYANLAVKFGKLKHVLPEYFAGHDSLFVNNYKTYAATDYETSLHHLLTPDITASLGHHFRQFDFEITEDSVYVYANNTTASSHTLNEMLRAGLWLSNHLDTVMAK